MISIPLWFAFIAGMMIYAMSRAVGPEGAREAAEKTAGKYELILAQHSKADACRLLIRRSGGSIEKTFYTGDRFFDDCLLATNFPQGTTVELVLVSSDSRYLWDYLRLQDI